MTDAEFERHIRDKHKNKSEKRFRPSCSSCSLGSLSSFMVSSSKAKSSRWVRAFSRLARRGFAFSGWGWELGAGGSHSARLAREGL